MAEGEERRVELGEDEGAPGGSACMLVMRDTTATLCVDALARHGGGRSTQVRGERKREGKGVEERSSSKVELEKLGE